MPASKETVENRQHFVFQDGKTVFKYAVSGMADISDKIMQRNNLTNNDVNWLIAHQANKRIIDATASRMNLDEDKVLPLHARGISFDDGFRHLCGLIDSHLHQPQSLALLGIDDLFYRNIALMMRPGLFLIQDHAEKRTDWKTIDGLCEYIEANLDKRLTLTDFEQVSGLSARGLQFAFQRRFQCTPMEWVRWERLVLARKRLSNAIPGTTVMAVALACGFSNPGKFARHYQKRFGELPSDTLARSFAA